MDIAAVRDALSTRLATITGLRVEDTFADSVSPPCVLIALRPPIDYHQDFDEHAIVRWSIAVYVQRSASGVDALDGYMSPTGSSSVKAAVEGDSDLGGAVSMVTVLNVSGYGVTSTGEGEVPYLLATWDVETTG